MVRSTTKTTRLTTRSQATSTQLIDISNMAACVEDVRLAALDSDVGPSDPQDFGNLMGRLVAASDTLPPLYRETVYNPFMKTMADLGPDGFMELLLSDPSREYGAGLLLDVAHAILQNGERYEEQATDAFQEVVSDIYDGFLSMEDRLGVNPPDHSVVAPLVKWGKPDFGPYTWTISATKSIGLGTGIVNLPPSNARRGLLAWSSVGHETAGHDVLHADEGLAQELSLNLFNSLNNSNLGNVLPSYWSSRIDETASDVLGILNTGPSAGIGLIGYFRGLNAAFTGDAKLRNEGLANDPHPADILRAYLAAATVRLLEFEQAGLWADRIEQEVVADLSTISIDRRTITAAQAKQSAAIVASTIAGMKLQSLQNHSLGEIQNWRDQDEELAQQIRRLLTRAERLPKSLETGMYGAHVVAAGVIAALAGDGPLQVIFDRMKSLLKLMHDANPSWGPLFVLRPGNLVRHLTYQRH